MTEQADLTEAMDELRERHRKREAQRRATMKMLDELWRNAVKLHGEDETKRMFTEVTDLKFAGRPDRRDVLDDLIDEGIEILGIEYFRSKGVQKANQKRFAHMIQNAIKKQPLTDHVPVWDEDEGDWDYEEVVKYTRVEAEMLRKRISAGITRYEQAHGS